jgi:hypothetical protein
MLPFAAEDAYITFRFARNLATGHGLVFNLGERVFGFSSPPWTLWCALGQLVTQDLVLWTRLTTLFTDILTFSLIGRMLESEIHEPGTAPRRSAWCFNLFFAAWPYFSAVSASGMENSAMLALIVLSAAFARRGHPVAGPLLGVLALWRPEGIACSAVIMMGARTRDRLVGLAVLAAGVTALSLYFGSPVPESLLAKSSLYGTPGPWSGRYWWGWAVPIYLGATQNIGETRILFPLAVLFGPALVAGAPVLWRHRAGPLALTVAACAAVWAGYASLGVAYFFWYLVVPLGGLAAAAAVGLPRMIAGRWLYASAALLVASSWMSAYPLYMGRAQNEFYGFAQVADWLGRYARPGEKVMLEPIGMVGWRNPAVDVVDEVGLVSPGVARRRMQGPGWYADIAGAERPDWIVMRRGVLTSGAGFAGSGAPFRAPAERDSLLARFEVATRIDEIAGDGSLVVLRRVRP